MRGLVSIVFILVVLLLPGMVQAQRGPGRLSPRLVMLTSNNPELVESAKRHLIFKTAPESLEPMVDTLVRMHGDPRALEVYGAKVRSVLGDVATVAIPISRLETIANDPDVIRIEEARKLKPRLDVSVSKSGANSVWGGSTVRPLPPSQPPPQLWTGNTGRNVVVGLVDTGIDLKHGDFKDILGKSRLLYVWDQNTTGAPPTEPGLHYGNECTKQQIDAGSCTEKDTDGHGTHVLGIAAGDGSATGHNQSPYRYIGMAPEANLIVVNTDFTDAGIEDGISYIETKAAALGLPVVINLSLGGHNGPHDGTSNFEVAMDSASGAGKVIVAAAGNEAEDQIHASDLGTNKVIDGEVGPTVSFSVPKGSTDVVLDLWYPGADQMGVKVTGPSGACTAPSSGFQYPGNSNVPLNTSCGQIALITPPASFDYLNDNLNNGDHEIYIEIQNIGHAISIGNWTFTLTGGGCPSPSPQCINAGGAFDVWVDDVASSATFVDHIDSAKTIGMPATATSVIAAASYVTKNCWKAVNGATYCYNPIPTVGTISTFSSLGPRRSCSANNAICNSPVRKPELAAPGQGIMSAFSSTATDPFITDRTIRDPDRVHALLQGTSMAAPHVTGASALLLAQDQSLTSDEVRTALENAQADGFTGAVPNNTWGYGKLGVDLAIATVGSSNPPLDPTPNPPLNVAAASGAGSATISWDAITNDIYLDGYNVYQSTINGDPNPAKVNTSVVSASSTSFKVTGLTVGTLYYFVVRSDDTPGIESANSSQVMATPTASSGGGGGGGGCGTVKLQPPSTPGGPLLFLAALFSPLLIALARRRWKTIRTRPSSCGSVP